MKNPLVTFVIVAYKHENFVREAIKGALQQTYSPLEIIISDDCSPDATYDVICQELEGYHGPHKVIVNKNDKNLGIVAHWNKVFKLSSGQLIVASASDDVSLPNRTQSLVDKWQNSSVSAVYSNAVFIDDEGQTGGEVVRHGKDHLDFKGIIQAGSTGVLGATAAWDREVFTTFGDVPGDVRNEDGQLAFRAGLLKGIAYLNQPLVQYRTHGDNISYGFAMKEADASTWLAMRRKMFENKIKTFSHWETLLQDHGNVSTKGESHHKYRILLQKKILVLKAENDLINNEKSSKISVLLRLVRIRVRPITCFRLCLLSFFPKLYARIIQRRAIQNGAFRF